MVTSGKRGLSTKSEPKSEHFFHRPGKRQEGAVKLTQQCMFYSLWETTVGVQPSTAVADFKKVDSSFLLK